MTRGDAFPAGRLGTPAIPYDGSVRDETEGGTPPTVLVTGASTGIGRAVAFALARRGFRVVAGVRRPASLEALRAEAERILAPDAAGRVEPLVLDITDADQVARAAARLEDLTGAAGLAGLVNNAGVVVAGPLEFLPLDDLRMQLEVNVVGQIAVTQAMLPMLRRGRGRLVFVGSISGLVASRLVGAYAASKFAIEAIGDAFRLELSPWGMQVSIVEPGRVRTPIWDKSRDAGEARLARMPEEAARLYAGTIRAVTEGVSDVDRAGIPPEGVARAVVHALTAPRARTRYRVGFDAKAVAVLTRLLPHRWMDAFLRLVRR